MSRFISRYCLIFIVASSLSAQTHKQPVTEASQVEPNPERVAEIQSALSSHGYDPGTTWEQTQEVCRKIADEHGWQTDHAPDARVLILIGLGGPHSDPAVTQMHGDRLDQDQRSEAARVNQNVTRSASRSEESSRRDDITSTHTTVSRPAANSFISRKDANGEGEARRASPARSGSVSTAKLIRNGTSYKAGTNSRKHKRRKQA